MSRQSFLSTRALWKQLENQEEVLRCELFFFFFLGGGGRHPLQTVFFQVHNVWIERSHYAGNCNPLAKVKDLSSFPTLPEELKSVRILYCLSVALLFAKHEKPLMEQRRWRAIDQTFKAAFRISIFGTDNSSGRYALENHRQG